MLQALLSGMHKLGSSLLTPWSCDSFVRHLTMKESREDHFMTHGETKSKKIHYEPPY